MAIDRARLLEIKRKAPLFIVGCQRSGTSFLYRSLSEVLDIGFGRDNTMFINLNNSIGRYGDLNQDEALRTLLNSIAQSAVFKKRFNNLQINSNDFIDSLETREFPDIVRTIFAFWALKHGKASWGGKTPDYTGHIESLNQLFPDAKVIHIVRDGRDVALSFFNLSWGPKDIYVAANYWKERIMRVNSDRKNLHDRFYELKYEDLLEDPVERFSQILDFLNHDDIDVEERVGRFRERIVPKVMVNNKFKWKKELSDNDVCLFELGAGEILEKYGYEIRNKDYRRLSLPIISKGYHYLRNDFVKVFTKVKKGHVCRYFSRRAFHYKY